jgi:hypothetical protein
MKKTAAWEVRKTFEDTASGIAAEGKLFQLVGELMQRVKDLEDRLEYRGQKGKN